MRVFSGIGSTPGNVRTQDDDAVEHLLDKSCLPKIHNQHTCPATRVEKLLPASRWPCAMANLFSDARDHGKMSSVDIGSMLRTSRRG